jgi:hypothetical protein
VWYIQSPSRIACQSDRFTSSFYYIVCLRLCSCPHATSRFRSLIIFQLPGLKTSRHFLRHSILNLSYHLSRVLWIAAGAISRVGICSNRLTNWEHISIERLKEHLVQKNETNDTQHMDNDMANKTQTDKTEGEMPHVPRRSCSPVRRLQHIPGPRSSSLIWDEEWELYHNTPGSHYVGWHKQFGKVVKFSGFWSRSL